MNTLGRLDYYVSSLISRPNKPSNWPSSPGSTSASPILSSAPSPAVQYSSTRSRKRRPRRRRQTYTSLSVPPPTTPIILRIALVLWSILLSFWRGFVGETRASRGRSRRRNNNGPLGGLDGLRELGERVMDAAGITAATATQGEKMSDGEEGEGSEEEPHEPDGAGSWVDPVTRAPEGQDSLEDAPPDEDDFVATATPVAGEIEEEKTVRLRADRGPDPNFTFRLRSAKSESPSSEKEVATGRRKPIPTFQRVPSPNGILVSPPTQAQARPEEQEKEAQLVPRQRLAPGLLAHPTSLLDPSLSEPNSYLSSYRVSTPPTPRRAPTTPFHLQKTLILDLDETLIHSTSRPLSYPGGSSGGGGILGLSLGGLMGGGKGRREGGHTVEVVVNGRSTMYHVYKRPYVDHFLKKVASWYTLVIFTASMPEYADPVIDWLDNGRNLFAKKLYRESCHQHVNGSYVKDLALVEKDLGKVCFMDNSPISYSWNKANALPIEGWTSDPNDEALLHSIPVLDSLRFVNDVRSVLGIRGFT